MSVEGVYRNGKTILLLLTCFTATIWLSRCSPRRSPTPAFSAEERTRLILCSSSPARPGPARHEPQIREVPFPLAAGRGTGRTGLGLHWEVAVEGAAERHGVWSCQLSGTVALSLDGAAQVQSRGEIS